MTTGESVKDGLSRLADDWGRFFFGFKRGVYMLLSSEKLQENRVARLDRAADVVVRGMASRMRSYVKSLKMPNLMLFSIGTVLPLVLVSLLPVVSVLGFSTHYAQIFTLLFLSLIGLYIYSGRGLSRRAVSFSEIEVEDVPGLPPRGVIRVGNMEVPALPYALAVFIALSSPGFFYLLGLVPGFEIVVPDYFSLFIVAGVVAAASLYCYGTSYLKVRLRNEAMELEDNIVDGLYHIASKMSEGRSAEDALAWASKSMPDGPAKKLFARALRRVKERQTTFEEALVQAMDDVYSKRVRSLMAALTTSLKRGIK
ncbi:MAG: hypothetical protein KAT35_05920, partial [Candidatus Aenigmarchaeota archaeon]|nr:hypothetical protein [Candidatus Aenigmarchaeota archaeon]